MLSTEQLRERAAGVRLAVFDVDGDGEPNATDCDDFNPHCWSGNDCTVTGTDQDEDGYCAGDTDCDDAVFAVNPGAVAAMAELGYDLSAHASKAPHDLPARTWDAIVTMGCGDACPFYPGKRYEDWVLEDPAGKGGD